MNLPPEQLRKLFPKRIRRGTIFKAPIHFDGTGHEKQKYIVVVGHDPQNDDPIVFFLTTSKLEIYDRKPHFKDNAVILEAKTLPFFPVRTAINCRELYPFPRKDIEDLFVEGHASLMGDLPADILKQVDNIVSKSALISPQDKIKILGDTPQ